MSAYFTRSSQSIIDCEFECPSCNNDLGDYLLLGKLITGLNDISLKREVFRICDTFTIDSLRRFCVAYESTKDIQARSATWYNNEVMAAGAAGVQQQQPTADDDVTIDTPTHAATRFQHQHNPAKNFQKPKAQCNNLAGPMDRPEMHVLHVTLHAITATLLAITKRCAERKNCNQNRRYLVQSLWSLVAT